MAKPKFKGFTSPAQTTVPAQAIDLTRLQRPEMVGFADACAVLERDAFWWELFFFERRDLKNSLAVGRIIMAVDDLLRLLDMTIAFRDQVSPMLRSAGIKMPDIGGESPKTVNEIGAAMATMVHVSRAGISGHLDFFHISSQAMHLAVTQNRKLDIDSVIGVQVPAALILAIMAKLEQKRAILERRAQQIVNPLATATE